MTQPHSAAARRWITSRRIARLTVMVLLAICCGNGSFVAAADLPDASKVTAEKILEVPNYCEGVVFDHQGRGYISWKDTITQFEAKRDPATKKWSATGKPWAVTGAPNGHKILADGTHLVCDASRHAVLHLDANGKMLDPASIKCNDKALRGPNDLTLDTALNGFYFTDPGESGKDNLIGTVHYVDAKGITHLVAGGLAFPNGIVLLPGGKTLLVAESQKNRILKYEVLSPGKVGELKVFAELPTKTGTQVDNQPDGICLDAAGNLYVAHYGMQQVQVLNPEGKLIARYPGGNLTTSNVAFSGPEHGTLFVTGGLDVEQGKGGLFVLELGTPGLKILPAK